MEEIITTQEAGTEAVPACPTDAGSVGPSDAEQKLALEIREL